MVVKCPWCGKRFEPHTDIASMDSFELFHVIRDEYSKATGMNLVDAKDTLCLKGGISIVFHPDFTPPKWPGCFVEYRDEIYFRKSTLAYTKPEMAQLIERALLELAEVGGSLP
jgi:hypothetical protein